MDYFKMDYLMYFGIALGVFIFSVSGYIGGAATRKLKELVPISLRGGINSGFFLGVSVYDASVPRSLQKKFFISRFLSFIAAMIGLIECVYFGWRDWVWIFLLSCVVGLYITLKDCWLFLRKD